MANQAGSGGAEVIWPATPQTDWIMRWRMKRRSTGAAIDLTDYEFTGQIRRKPGASSELFADVVFDKTEGNGYVTAMVRRNVVAAAMPLIGDMPFEFKYVVPEADSGVPGGALLPLFRGLVRVTPRIMTVDSDLLVVP